MSRKTDPSRRLTVNAAFLKDIKDDNRDLKILIDRMRLLTQRREAAANHWPELLTLLADLRDQLALHFGLEEAYGYFDDAIGTGADLSVTADILRSQHAVLFEEARHLAEAAADAHTGDTPIEGEIPEVTTAQERILNRFDEFLEQFHEHEEAELKLILDALEVDVGVGD